MRPNELYSILNRRNTLKLSLDLTNFVLSPPAHGRPEAFRPKLSPGGPDGTQEHADRVPPTLGMAWSESSRSPCKRPSAWLAAHANPGRESRKPRRGSRPASLAGREALLVASLPTVPTGFATEPTGVLTELCRGGLIAGPTRGPFCGREWSRMVVNPVLMVLNPVLMIWK